MEILIFILKALGMLATGVVLIALLIIVSALILGFIGVGLCDIEYDEDDDRVA